MNHTAQTVKPDAIDTLCINTIRVLSMEAVQKASSGHPGAPMGMAAAAYTLWSRFLKHNPTSPKWADRDRFVLSGGHASMLLYSLLYLSGYDLSLEDIQQFRQWGSKTPGHPEHGHTPGVETTTGPLGQGFANAVGMAMAERHLAATYNTDGYPLVDHFTYVMCGDGDLMEGVAYESASLAGHLGLGRLICIYDDNGITIEGSTDIAFTEDVAKRFEATGWHVQTVADGNDVAAIAEAIANARAATDQPSLILNKTAIAFGSPNKQGTSDAHGAPLGDAEIALTKECLLFPGKDAFCVPEAVLDRFQERRNAGEAAEAEWQKMVAAHKSQQPDVHRQFSMAITGQLPDNWDSAVPAFAPADGPLATRAASGKVLNGIAAGMPTLIGGSADLAPSNKTYIDGEPEFQRNAYAHRNIRFGVREFAMTAVMSGMYLHGGVRPYGGTFMVFSDYMRPAIRVAALMNLPVVYVLTHDSVAVGEDGPTHQPVEHLAAMRAIPGLTVLRPADATETAEAWRYAIAESTGPVALALSRQKLPILDRTTTADMLAKGGYILADTDGTPDIILIASGAEVHVAVAARETLAAEGIQARVVSMPSWELFDQAPADYRNQVLPPSVRCRLSIEAGITMGWEKYVGVDGDAIGINRFGASAPGAEVLEKLGISTANMVEQARALIAQK